MKISQIKKSCRKIIKGNVKNSAKLLLIFIGGFLLFSALPFLIDFFLNYNPIASAAILFAALLSGFIFFSSFRTGSGAWFLFYNKKRRSAKSAFWFKPSKAMKSFRLYFSLFLRKLLWSAAFLTPGVLLIFTSVFIASNGGVEFNLFAVWIAGGVVLMLTGAVFLYFFIQRYFLVPYLRAVDPKMKNRDIFSKSKEYMSHSITKTALLKISFIPWAVLSLTVIPSFYAWTYYSQSCALMAEKICRAQKEKQYSQTVLPEK